MLIGRLNNRYVRIVKTQETVGFSHERGWVLIEFDIHLPEHRRQQRRWVLASETRFDWVKEFNFGP